MRYLTFVRYDTNTGFACFWVNIYIITDFNFGSTEMWLYNLNSLLKIVKNVDLLYFVFIFA